MKELQHLSPSSISTYLTNPEHFYLKYLSDNRPEKEAQTKPMSVGSAFDSYVKAHLRYVLFGDNFDEVFDKYFTDSVEVVNRDFAIEAGKVVFENYKASGALNDLLIDMQQASEGPKFEFFIRTTDSENLKVYAGGVKFLGKPDAWYVNKQGLHIILDWKVNGYCSKASPKPGYVMIRDGLHGSSRPSRGVNKPHKDVFLMCHRGVVIDGGMKMEDKDQDWARQLSIYAWLCGEDIGTELVGAIDQIVSNDRNEIRVAEHRCLISPEFQQSTFAIAKQIWLDATDGYFFKNMSIEESQRRCAALDLIKDVQQDPRFKAMYAT